MAPTGTKNTVAHEMRLVLTLYRSVLLGLSILLASCGRDAPAPAPEYIAPEALKAHVAVLASDDMAGRKPGTEGYDKAATYVAEQFQAIGLDPVGYGGSYFQPIVFKHMKIIPETARFVVRSEGDPIQLQYVDSYYFVLNATKPTLDISASLVFAGFGITAPEFGLNGYKDIEAEGKIAVVMAGVPSGLDGEISAIFAKVKRKAADARKAGAVGLIVVYSQALEEFQPFATRASTAAAGKFHWLSDDGVSFSDYEDLALIMRMAPEKGGLLFDGAQLSYDALQALLTEGKPLPSFAMPASVTAAYAVSEKTSISSNVIGKLSSTASETPAADAEVGPKEAVMLISHLDHLGLKEDDSSNAVYNGAIDNALGVATLIETAKMLARTPQPLKKDVYFAALTAEEAGLLGSQYLARNLPMPPETLAAVLNIDMPVALYPFATIQASGENHSNLGLFAKQAAARYGLDLEDDPMPEEAIFIRSDHYSFVERGTPAIYLNIGSATPEGSGIDGRQMRSDFLSTHYHQTTDDITLPIDWGAAALFGNVHIEMLSALAQTDQTIAWSKESFFNQPRALE